jgi:hypothetical protein
MNQQKRDELFCVRFIINFLALMVVGRVEVGVSGKFCEKVNEFGRLIEFTFIFLTMLMLMIFAWKFEGM